MNKRKGVTSALRTVCGWACACCLLATVQAGALEGYPDPEALIWSPWQYGVRVGLLIHSNLVHWDARTVWSCEVYAQPDDSYQTNMVKLPGRYQRFQIELLDSRGHSVARTAVGKRYRQRLPRRLTRSEQVVYRLHWRAPYTGPETIDSFHPDELFEIPEWSHYTLEVTVRLLRSTNNWQSFQPVTYGPIRARVYLKPPGGFDRPQSEPWWWIVRGLALAVLVLVWAKLRRTWAGRRGEGGQVPG
jgi:hypothetical protein